MKKYEKIQRQSLKPDDKSSNNCSVNLNVENEIKYNNPLPVDEYPNTTLTQIVDKIKKCLQEDNCCHKVGCSVMKNKILGKYKYGKGKEVITIFFKVEEDKKKKAFKIDYNVKEKQIAKQITLKNASDVVDEITYLGKGNYYEIIDDEEEEKQNNVVPNNIPNNIVKKEKKKQNDFVPNISLLKEIAENISDALKQDPYYNDVKCDKADGNAFILQYKVCNDKKKDYTAEVVSTITQLGTETFKKTTVVKSNGLTKTLENIVDMRDIIKIFYQDKVNKIYDFKEYNINNQNIGEDSLKDSSNPYKINENTYDFDSNIYESVNENTSNNNLSQNNKMSDLKDGFSDKSLSINDLI